MKKSRLLTLLLACMLVVIGVVTVACGETKNPPTPTPTVVTGNEVGVYYFDPGTGEYLLSLNKDGTVSLTMEDIVATGTFTRDGDSISLKYKSGGIEDMTATINSAETEITLTYNGKAMTFLRRVTFRITFDTALGSKVDPIEVLNGKTLSAPATPTREGYAFVGWYKDSGFKTPFAFDSEKIVANLTLYAQWIERKADEQIFTVKFSVGDYAGAEDPQPKQTASGKLYNLETPEREGYEFKGWWYSVSGKADELTYRVDANTVYYESTTLYAVWQGAQQGAKLQAPLVDVTDGRISWDLVPGAVEYKIVVTDADDKTVIERSVTSTSTGLVVDKAGSYTVKVTAISGTSESNNSETTVRKYNYMTLTRVSLFDVVNERILSFNDVANATKYMLKIDCGDPTHTHNPDPDNIIFELHDNGTNTTYDFGNCPMKKGGIVFTVIAEGEGYASSESEPFPYDRLLAAIAQGSLKYDAATETISWDAVAGATGYEVVVGDNDAVTVDGTSFDLRSYAAGSLSVSVSPIAHGYNSPAATVIKVNKTTLAAPVNVIMAGSVVKWDEVSGAEKYVVEVGGKSFDVTGKTEFDLAAAEVDWNKNTDYAVTVKAQSGTKSSLASEPIALYYQRMGALSYEGGKVSWGYVLGASGYDVRVNGGEATRVEGADSADIVFTQAGDNLIEVRYVNGSQTSAWEKITVVAYELVYDLNGASGRLDAQYYAYGDPIRPYTAGDLTTELTGHRFNDWYTSGSENGQRYEDAVYSVKEDTRIYANWLPRTYKLTLNYNSGGTGITEWEVIFGKPFTLPLPATVLDGTTQFGGWCANAIGTAASFTDEQGHSVMNWNIASDTEVFAKWLSVYKFEKAAGGSAGFYYMLVSGDVQKEVTTATIPAYYRAPGDDAAYPVTQIGTNAFNSCQGVQVINLPSTIESILPRAFENYKTLREINVYQVEGVSNNTYWSQDGVLFYNNGTAGTVDIWAIPRAFTGDKDGKYTIPGRVTSIPSRTFYHIQINELEIPASVTYIASEAFYYSESPVVRFLSAGEGEEAHTLRLETGAFYYADMLEAITLPAHDFVVWNSTDEKPVENLDFKIHVFPSCKMLTNVYVDENNQNYQSIEGMLCTKGEDSTLLYCPNSREGVITIPVGIVKIGKGAFSNCRGITELIIPNWVKSIEGGAFSGSTEKPAGASYTAYVYGCDSLEKVTFTGGDGVAVGLTIGKDAFGSKTLSSLYYCSNLSTIVFEEGSNVEIIGEYAFARCPITSIILPATLSEIMEGAFYSCASLVTVEYAPNGKDISIGDQVFANCTSFTTVKLPANVTEFKDGVFAGCNNLSSVEVDPDNEVLASIDGVLFTKDEKEILFFPFGKEGNYQIPDSVERISSGAFSGKENITDVTIGKNVTYIGASAFRYCINLESVIFEDGGTEELVIGAGAFQYCQKLKTFHLPDRVKAIPDRMLSWARDLREIYIPEGVETIGDFAFTCVAYESFTNLTMPYPALVEKVVIPSTVKSMGVAVFYNCSFKEIEFKNSADRETGLTLNAATVKKSASIGPAAAASDAFWPVSTEIGDSLLFYMCQKLEKITLPEGLKNIGVGMFRSCTKLESIEIPGTVTELGQNSFTNNTSLKTITFAERPVDPETGKPLGLTFADGTYSSSSGSSGSSVTRTGVFANCTNLETVVLPEGLTRISDYAFESCSKLTSVTFPSSLENGSFTSGTSQKTAIGTGAFKNCTKLSELIFMPGGTGDFSLGQASFEGCSSLTSITLPANLADAYVYNTTGKNDVIVCGVRNIYPTSATNFSSESTTSFYNCSQLAEINVAEGGERYASHDGILYTAGLTELVYVPVGRTKDITVPSTVTLVRDAAFFANKKVTKVTFAERTPDEAQATAEGETPADNGLVIGQGTAFTTGGAFANSKIEEINFPSHLVEIKKFAFYNCASLTTVTFANGTNRFTTIGERAFEIATKLSAFTLPDSVTELGNRVFWGDTGLTTFTVTQNSRLNKVGDLAFYNTAIREFYLPPAQTMTIGSGAFSNCIRLTTVHIPNTVSSFDGLFSGSFSISTLDIYPVDGVTGSLESDNDVIFVDGGKTLSYYPVGKTDKTYTVPDGVTKIAASAFANNGYLEEVIIPASVSEVGDKAFYMMSALKKVVFEKDDTSLKYVLIGDDETYTGDRYSWNEAENEYVLSTDGTGEYKGVVTGATTLKVGTTNATSNSNGGVFAHCPELTTVNFPARLEQLTSYALYYCPKLTTVTFDAGCKLGSIEQAVFAETALQYGGTREDIAEDPTHGFELPSNLGSIAAQSSSYNVRYPFGHVKKLVIPASVTNIGNYAFYSYTSTSAGMASLDARTYLEEVEFAGTYSANNKLTLGMYLFQNSTKLTKATLPEGVTTLGGYMFDGCTALTTVTLPNSITTFGTYTFRNCTALKAITLPSSLTGVASSAFYGCTALGSDETMDGVLTIPSKVTTLSSSCFYNCTSLKQVLLPGALTKIESSAFYGCTQLKSITTDPTKDYDLYLSSTAASLSLTGAGAFAGTPIESAYIPEKIGTSISTIFGANQTNDPTGTTKPYVCEQLKKVEFNPSCTITSVSTTFMQLPALEEVILPTATTFKTISAGAFSHSGLQRITIPASVTTINRGAFSCCERLQYVKFAQSNTALTITAGSQISSSWSNYQYYGVFAFSGTNNGRAEAKAAAEAVGATQEVKDAYAANFVIDMSERTVTTLTQWTFYGTGSLDVKLAGKTIASLAFEGATLDRVEIPATTTTLQVAAFALSSVKEIKFAASDTALSIAAGTDVVNSSGIEANRKKNGVFAYNPALTKVDMSERKVLTIPERTFFNCPNITEFKWSVATAATDDEPMTTHTTSIGNWAFEYSMKMDTLDLPRGLTSIGQAAFWESAFKYLKIPNTITTLGNSAFYQNEELLSVEFEKGSTITAFNKNGSGLSWTFGHCHKLASIVLPESLTEIGGNEYYRTALTSISIPKGVTKIGNYAFGSCYDLETVTFEREEDGSCALTTLGNCVFNRTGIASMTVPKSVTTLGANPFSYCSNLTSLTVEEGNENFVAENNVLYNGDKSVLLAYAGGLDGAFAIPGSVTQIGDWAFAGSKWAGTLSVATDGFIVGSSAFEACGITSVTLGENSILYSYAFSDCADLASVTIGSGAEIGNMAFENCETLTTFVIPDNTTVSITAFMGSGVDFTEEMLKDDTVLKYGALGAYLDGTLVFDSADAAATALKDNSDLEYVALAEGVTTIGASAFKDITNLKKIVLPSTLTEIGANAFQNCTSLKEVVFNRDEDGNTALTMIYRQAFENTGIVEIEIPKNVVNIMFQAFQKNSKLTKVTFEKGSLVTAFCYTSPVAATVTDNTYTFAECPKLETLELPENLTVIPQYLCQKSGLTSITIPASVTGIGQYAFDACTSLETVNLLREEDGSCALTTLGNYAFQNTGLTSISIPASVTTIGTNMFNGCASLASVTFETDDEGNVGVTTLNGYMFTGTAITSFTIPNGVTSIGTNLFQNCTQLTSVTLSDAITSIGGSTFSGCAALTSISIPATVTTIGANAFQNCTSLSSVTFAKDEDGNCAFAYTGNYAFANTALTSISLPKSYTGCSSGTSAATYVFQGCANLATVTYERDADGNCALIHMGNYSYEGTAITSISVPCTVTTIGQYAFQNCKSLESVTFEKNEDDTCALAKIDKGAFKGSAITAIEIPYTVTVLAEEAFMDCASLTSVTWSKDASGNTAASVNIGSSTGSFVFTGCTSLKHLIIPMGANLGHHVFYGLGSDVTIYFISLPGPKASWGGKIWRNGCEAKFVWYWSEEKGFLNEDGTFSGENA